MKFQMHDITAPLANTNIYTKKDYKTKEEIVDDEGRHVFCIRVLLQSDNTLEEMTIQVHAKENPVEGLPLLTPLAIIKPVISVGTLQDGKRYYVITAASVKRA